ncbi:uncharacterized protein LOC116415994 [Nasonia vitripennis]|uniref:DNA-directed DNA polymerase n=1 Tax=Nasonia vitripennis TaxID=7425 RepID=A0A7M7Q188_NASVI|nr:uncharacterized protein LOC116415994 [Nasonia vitripennis]
MASVEDCREAVAMMQEALSLMVEGAIDDASVERWTNVIVPDHIATFERLLETPGPVALLHTLRYRMSCCVKRGGSLQQPSVAWNKVKSAFARHLDISTFMDDARALFASKIELALREHNAVKVNTVLAAEYVIVKNDEGTKDIKYYNTKSASIYQTTDFNEWYTANVQQPIERDIEEFQERYAGECEQVESDERNAAETHRQVREADYYVDEDDNDDDEEVEDDDDIELLPKFHYVLIKDLSRLVSAQLSNRAHKQYICERCLHYFRNQLKLRAHEVDCAQVNQCKVKLPTKHDNILKFKNFGHRERVPLVVYADFECLSRPVDDDDERAYQQHEPFSVGFYLRFSFDDSRSEYKCYRQIDEGSQSSAEWFVKSLQALTVEMKEIYKNPKPMNALTASEREEFERAIVCYICRKPFSAEDTKVKDHCHLTGRGPAHNKCNTNYNDSRTIPVIFHNLSGYDSHLFIKEIATCFKGRV